MIQARAVEEACRLAGVATYTGPAGELVLRIEGLPEMAWKSAINRQ